MKSWPVKILIWAVFVLAILIPLGVAATSPLLAWREPIYIVAGFAGVLAMGLLLKLRLNSYAVFSLNDVYPIP